MTYSITVFTIEFRRYFKLALIWGLLFGIVGFSTFGLFDTLRAQSDQLNALLAAFPRELITAFGADTNTLATIAGYYNARFMSLVLLINGVLAIYLGGMLLGQEIAQGQILFLITKPVARWQIYIMKFLATAGALAVANIVIGVFSYLGAELLTAETDTKLGYFILVTLAAWLFQVFFLATGMLIGTVFSGSQSMIIGLGLSFGSFIIDTISKISGAAEFLKYITPYYYFDLKYLGENLSVKPEFGILILATIIMLVAGIWWFRRRDLV